MTSTRGPAPAEPWRVQRDPLSRVNPWRWFCTAIVDRPQQAPATCPGRGPARSEAAARRAAERHATSVHNYTAPEA
ncbi:hypothetical protein [Streptomyces syringium]|uniref:hypothetical protein n=1 Tax=Streptomyces syringium TaxID=76729 RepID=UPI0037D06312